MPAVAYHKTESSQHGDFIDCSEGLEKVPEVLVADRVREVTDVELRSHLDQ